MAMTVSTAALMSFSPSSACLARTRPSNSKGRVQMARQRMSSSAARLAMIGVAPVPVPPPRPAVRKTMSEPSRISRSFSVSSMAACLPCSGRPPEPSPLVSWWPIWILFGALFVVSAWRSVLTAMKSTPSIPASIIRLRALPPPPPTPMTRILALNVSSTRWNFNLPVCSLPMVVLLFFLEKVLEFRKQALFPVLALAALRG